MTSNIVKSSTFPLRPPDDRARLRDSRRKRSRLGSRDEIHGRSELTPRGRLIAEISTTEKN